MNDKEYSFVQEIASSYEAKEILNGDLQINITVPKRFKSLAMIKMSELKVTDEEIKVYSDENEQS